MEYDPIYNTWYCTNCGSVNSTNDNICQNCKSNLDNKYIHKCDNCSIKNKCHLKGYK